MFSSIEAAVAWAAKVSGVPASTDVRYDANGAPLEDAPFCIVSRTGGELDYPHDSPEITFELWAQTETRAEELANIVAIACKTMPPEDEHVNQVDVPRMYSYGLQEGGWHVWDVAVTWRVNLQD